MRYVRWDAIGDAIPAGTVYWPQPRWPMRDTIPPSLCGPQPRYFCRRLVALLPNLVDPAREFNLEVKAERPVTKYMRGKEARGIIHPQPKQVPSEERFQLMLQGISFRQDLTAKPLDLRAYMHGKGPAKPRFHDAAVEITERFLGFGKHIAGKFR